MQKIVCSTRIFFFFFLFWNLKAVLVGKKGENKENDCHWRWHEHCLSSWNQSLKLTDIHRKLQKGQYILVHDKAKIKNDNRYRLCASEARSCLSNDNKCLTKAVFIYLVSLHLLLPENKLKNNKNGATECAFKRWNELKAPSCCIHNWMVLVCGTNGHKNSTEMQHSYSPHRHLCNPIRR